MELARIKVSGVRATPCCLMEIPAGLIGATVRLEYADPVWEGLTKTVVFQSCSVRRAKVYATKDVVNAGEEVTVPADVLAEPNRCLYVGIYGTKGESIAVPTLWADLGRIRAAADPSGDESTDPALPVWAQILALIGDLDDLNTDAKTTLVAAINEAAKKGGGSVDEEAVWKIVEDYLAQNPPDPGADGITPHIGDNGNWYIGETDTGKPSRGEDGAAGPQGPAGAQGPQGETGATGPVGPQGLGEKQALRVNRGPRVKPVLLDLRALQDLPASTFSPMAKHWRTFLKTSMLLSIPTGTSTSIFPAMPKPRTSPRMTISTSSLPPLWKQCPTQRRWLTDG